MAFIVRKKIGGRFYYYLRESKRENGKVRAITLCYLGKTRKEAEEKKKELDKRKEFKVMKKKRVMESEKTERAKKVEKDKKGKPISSLTIEELANFCKRKGFVFRSSDIYGGFSGFWDFGHLGIELLNNIKREWWDFFVKKRQDIVGIGASIISHPKTWKASGHLESFKDVIGKCKNCGRFSKLEERKCLCGGKLEKVEDFNLMFETKVGAGKDSIKSYLRPETAQGMFLDFKLIQQSSRMQLPFGIAQIGKCFRNEIAPREFLFRSREFHIAEIEYFINPKEKKCPLLSEKLLKLKFKFVSSEEQKKERQNLKNFKEITISELLKKKKLEEWHAYWLAEQILFFKELGLEEIKIREHTKEELSHYSSATFDIDYEYSFGSKEVAGIANRGQFDLAQHEKESKEKLEIFDCGESVKPKVIEPTFGIERIFLALLTKAYNYDEKRGNIVLKLPKKLAPIKVGVFPIVKKPEFLKIAKKIAEELREEFSLVYDEGGSIGRRYARQDEAGTPFCITIDGDSVKNKDVTIRERDTSEQIRVKISNLKEIIKRAIDGEEIMNLGRAVNTRKKL